MFWHSSFRLYAEQAIPAFLFPVASPLLLALHGTAMLSGVRNLKAEEQCFFLAGDAI